MDCIHARLVMVLHSRQSQELDADARAALEQHLEVCADCLAWSNQESRVDEAIGAAVRAVPAPAALPSKILHQLEQRRPWRRGPWISAAAACLLMSMSIGGYVWFSEKPELTMTDIQVAISIQESATPYDVEQYFADRSMPIKVPEDFRFEFYQGHSIADVQGHKVPCIDFFSQNDQQSNAALARVYVVAKDRFQVEDIIAALKAGPIVMSKHRIEARDFPDHPAYVYVIVYTGSTSQPFFIARPTA